MEEFVIVEVGSTTTKAYLCKDNDIKNIGFKIIEFKKNYSKEKKITNDDKNALFNFLRNSSELPRRINVVSLNHVLCT